MSKQLSFSQFDFFPESDTNQAQNKIGTGKQFAYDCGEELHGARKHHSFDWKQIESDPSQAYQLVCKDKLLGGFSAENLREQGYTSEAAYAIHLIWSYVAQRPEDSANAREDYLEAVDCMREMFSETKDEESVREAIAHLRVEFRNAHLSINGYNITSNSSWLSLGRRYKSLFIGSRSTSPRYSQLLDEAFTSEKSKDWLWTKPKKREINSRKENIEKWQRRVPAEVIRLSQESSGVSHPEDFINQYGFRGIQFGNWVEDEAGRYHVLCCGNALADLTHLLQLPKKAASFYSSLGLAFGARGSGKAVAHYEPRENVINITKIRGGGSLCHEWAHALDFNLYAISHNNQKGKRLGLSGNTPGEFLNKSVAKAFKELMQEIKVGSGCIRVPIVEPLPQINHGYKLVVKAFLRKNNDNINAALVALKESNYRINSKMWLEIGFMYVNMLKNDGKEVPEEFLIPTDESYFLIDARKRGNYWKSDHELFARAFESWIEDELEDRGMTNTYLVSGTRDGGPYPFGNERLRINAAFRVWWRAMADAGILHKEQLWNMEGNNQVNNINKIARDIELKRQELNQAGERYPLTNSLVITLSVELDKLLNDYRSLTTMESAAK